MIQIEKQNWLKEGRVKIYHSHCNSATWCHCNSVTKCYTFATKFEIKNSTTLVFIFVVSWTVLLKWPIFLSKNSFEQGGGGSMQGSCRSRTPGTSSPAPCCQWRWTLFSLNGYFLKVLNSLALILSLRGFNQKSSS